MMEGDMRPITVGLDAGSAPGATGGDATLFRQFRAWDVIVRGMSSGTIRAAHWPNFVLCSIIWIIMACAYTYVKIRQTADPTYYVEPDDKYFERLKITLMVLISLYLLLLIYRMYKSICYIRSLAKHYIFVLVVTFFSIILVMCGLYAQAYYFMGQSVVFIIFSSMVNVYIWMLMVVFAPRSPGEYGVDHMTDHMAMSDLAGDTEWDTSTDELDGGL